jgi:hypothetical protein
MFWRKKRKTLVNEAAQTVTDLADKTLTIGPTGVAMLLGAAALGAAAAYVYAKRHEAAKGKKQGSG